MPNGFRARNNTNTTQIDSSYANYALRESGSFGPTSEPTVESTPAINMPPAANLTSLLVHNETTQAPAVTGVWGRYMHFQSLKDFTPPVSAGYGLRVRDPLTGAVCYDSRQKVLNVVDVIKVSYPSIQAALTTTYTYPAGRTYRCCVLDCGGYSFGRMLFEIGFGEYMIQFSYYGLRFTVNGNTVTVGPASGSYDDIGIADDFGQWGAGIGLSLLVVDVTGF